MKLDLQIDKKARIEMLPLIDIVFLLLVFFIYAMLSMAVHRGVSVMLPSSSIADIDQKPVLSISVTKTGNIFVDEQRVSLEYLAKTLMARSNSDKKAGVLLFADHNLSYQKLFKVLDQIRRAGLNSISLQAEMEQPL